MINRDRIFMQMLHICMYWNNFFEIWWESCPIILIKVTLIVPCIFLVLYCILLFIVHTFVFYGIFHVHSHIILIKVRLVVIAKDKMTYIYIDKFVVHIIKFKCSTKTDWRSVVRFRFEIVSDFVFGDFWYNFNSQI